MAGLVDAGKNLLLDGLTAAAGYVSLHTADPSTGGTSEVCGSPYARKAVTWDSASAGSAENSGGVVFDVPGTTTITHLGYWSAVTSGTFYGSRALNASQEYTTVGTYTITAGNLTEAVA